MSAFPPSPPNPQHFVFETTEVKKTGRTARKRSTMNKTVEMVMFEITPADPESIAWKKWVQESELYIIDPPTDSN